MICPKVSWKTVDVILHHQQPAIVNSSHIFFDETYCPITVSVLFLRGRSDNFFWRNFLIAFVRLFSLSNRFLSLLSLEYSVMIHLVFEFLAASCHFSGCWECLVTMHKVNLILRKTLITVRKLLLHLNAGYGVWRYVYTMKIIDNFYMSYLILPLLFLI